MLCRIYLLLIFLSASLCGTAQIRSQISPKTSFGENVSLQFNYEKGHIFGTNDFLKGNNAQVEALDKFQAFSLRFAKQTTGQKDWEQLFNYPNFGIGLYVASIDNSHEIGIPIALYGFINAPFKRWNRSAFNYDLGFGAAFNWRSFNPVNNQFNTALGAGQSFFISGGLSLQHYVSKNIDIETGVSLAHFSNGALKKPNKGVNTVAPEINLRYHFNNRPLLKRQIIPAHAKENEWLISGFGGFKNVVFDSVDIDVREKFKGVYYPVFGLSTVFNRQISHKSKIGMGMTVSYNGTVNAQGAVDENELERVIGPFRDKIQLSIYPSYELVINRISILLQPAFYLYRKELEHQSPRFHQRIGLKYRFGNKFFAGITLRDYNFHVSDFIEWNMGYRIK